MTGTAKKWLNDANLLLDISNHLFCTYHPLPAKKICCDCYEAIELGIKAVLFNSRHSFKVEHEYDVLALIAAHGDFFAMNSDIFKRIVFMKRFVPSKMRYPNELSILDSDVEIGLKFTKQILDWCRLNIMRYDENWEHGKL